MLRRSGAAVIELAGISSDMGHSKRSTAGPGLMT
jgi:hypothetical protein